MYNGQYQVFFWWSVAKKIESFEWGVILSKTFTLNCMCTLQTWTLPGKFLGIVGQDPSDSKYNQLHVHIFRLCFQVEHGSSFKFSVKWVMVTCLCHAKSITHVMHVLCHPESIPGLTHTQKFAASKNHTLHHFVSVLYTSQLHIHGKLTWYLDIRVIIIRYHRPR